VTARRWIVAAGVAAVPAALALGFGHRGVHAARSLLVPGAGLLATSSRPSRKLPERLVPNRR